MTRRCSHCSNNGHNSRTCPSRGGGVKLFGVRLTDGSIMKKSASMGNLSALYHSSSPAANPSSPSPLTPSRVTFPTILLTPLVPLSVAPIAKKKILQPNMTMTMEGTPWTEEEHRLFLLGLQKLGKGDWRGIARNYVLSRTPTQVASHAQKHFIRQCSATRRKRRSSLFDMAPDTTAEPPEDQCMLPPVAGTDHSENPQCSINLSLKPDSDQSMALQHDSDQSMALKHDSDQSMALEADPDQFMEPEITEVKREMKEEEHSTTVSELPPIVPAFYPTYIPVPYTVWPSTMTSLGGANYEGGANESHHRVVKPIPVLQKEPLNLDELVGMSSQLTLKDDNTTDRHQHMGPSPLSLKLLAEPSRQSAFHASTPVIGGSGVNKRDGDAFQAI